MHLQNFVMNFQEIYKAISQHFWPSNLLQKPVFVCCIFQHERRRQYVFFDTVFVLSKVAVEIEINFNF